jgi:Tetratricopeptide repeat
LPAKRNADPEAGLQKAEANAENDSAALTRNLKAHLQKFPDAPRKAGVYHALVEACEQLRDSACALDYAERLIALHPDDSQMLLLAVNLLEHRETTRASRAPPATSLSCSTASKKRLRMKNPPVSRSSPRSKAHSAGHSRCSQFSNSSSWPRRVCSVRCCAAPRMATIVPT